MQKVMTRRIKKDKNIVVMMWCHSLSCYVHVPVKEFHRRLRQAPPHLMIKVKHGATDQESFPLLLTWQLRYPAIGTHG